MRPHLDQQLGVEVRVCHPSYVGIINRWIVAQASLGIKARPHCKNN
jgi:hypothetical protein